MLKKELKHACSRYKDYRRPEILVYIQDGVDKFLKEDIHKILIINGLGSGTIEETEELIADVEEKIEKYIDSYYVLKKIYKNERRKKRAVKVAFISIILFFFALGTIILLLLKTEKRLLIAGGGSAEHFIVSYAKSKTGNESVTKDIFRIYSPIPSRNAYRLLTEETQMDISENNYKNRHFYTIILSAGKANIYDFLRCGPTKDTNIKNNNIKDFRKIGVVIGIHIGFDSLVVYSKMPNSISRMPKKILPDALNDSIFSLGKDIIYTTNIGSGTLNAYNECFKANNKDTIVPLEGHVFYSSNPIECVGNNNKWIALGSKYYSPKHGSSDGIDTTVVDNVKPKPVYVYFLKYKDENRYVIPKETQKFLKDIGISDAKIKEIEKSQVNDTTILFDCFCAGTACKDINHIHLNK